MVENSYGTISARSRDRRAKQQSIINGVTQNMRNAARGNRNSGRLCGDLTILEHHDSTMEKTGKEHTCVVRGETCIARCDMCPGKPYVHYQVARGKCKNKKKLLDYHKISNFGVVRNGCMMFGQSRVH